MDINQRIWDSPGTRPRPSGDTIRRSILILLTVLACLSAPAAAGAATPFTAGVGSEPSVAVGPDGTGHVVWQTNEANVKVGYCRISPGASACNRFELLPYGASTAANDAGRARVFAPSPTRVVIVSACWNCPTGIADRTYRWESSNGGTTFGSAVQIGEGIETAGFGTWLDDLGRWIGASGSRVKAAEFTAGEGVQYATGGLFVYGPEVTRLPGTNKLVAATNDLEVVRYGVYNGLSTTVAGFNNAANWAINRSLVGAEPDNSDTALNSGPNGVFLSYLYFVANDNHVGLRRFDPATDTFGPPIYVEGPDPIDNVSLRDPDSFQDPSGRIHVAWSSLFDGGRLRYRVSDPSGTVFTPTANLATSETFTEPEIAAGPDGRGFAAWTPNVIGAIRIVPLDPQAEPSTPPAPAPAPDTTKPTLSGFEISDKTLLPGQKARFSFRASEAGLAVLTVEKRFFGLKGKRKGKRVCLPKTKKRLAALRRQAGSRAALAKLLKRKRCRGYRRIGQIRQRVTAGRNTIEFGGRIAGRKLKPGVYRASLTVTDAAGLVSRTERVNFKVIGKKKKPSKRRT